MEFSLYSSFYAATLLWMLKLLAGNTEHTFYSCYKVTKENKGTGTEVNRES